jgi:hypothetical protein
MASFTGFNVLTASVKVILGKLMIAELIRYSFVFYKTKMIHYFLPQSRRLDYVLKQLNSVHTYTHSSECDV